MAKVLIGLFVAVSVLPVLATSGQARDVGIGVQSFAQDKIAFDSDKTTPTVEASSTYDGKDVQADQATEGK